MEKRKFVPLIALALVLALGGCSPAGEEGPGLLRLESAAGNAAGRSAADDFRRFGFYYSASLTGNLEGCTCEYAPAAGLVKRGAFLRSDQADPDIPRIDGGDLLPVYPDPDLAPLILESYLDLGYSAVAVGELDLQMGARELRRWASRLPLIGHNLRLRRGLLGWSRFSREPLYLSAGEARLAAFALLEPALLEETHPDFRHSFRLDPPLTTARAMLEQAEARGVDLVLLLYHGTRHGLEELLASLPGIDLVLLAHEGRLVDAEWIGDTLVVSPGELGNRLGRIEGTVGGTAGAGSAPRPRGSEPANRFQLFSFRGGPDDPVLRERADRYRDLLRSRLQNLLPK